MNNGTIDDEKPRAMKARWRHVVIEYVGPQVDGGSFPVKRVVGEEVTVRAQIFCDGNNKLRAELLWRHELAKDWEIAPMEYVVNDEWEGTFEIAEMAGYCYTVRAWIDEFETWRQGLRKKADAGQEVGVELMMGAEIIERAAQSAGGQDAKLMTKWAGRLREQAESALEAGLSEELSELMKGHPDRSQAVEYPLKLEVSVTRRKALFSAWYEMFPRSSAGGGRHGTFADCEKLLPDIKKLGFDVLYLPPIHRIGKTNRKGKNNSPICSEGEPGSPWAIGSAEGGHKAIKPELGDMEDFQKLMERAKKYDIEIAMDMAFQCSPDHPYVTEHPEWFRWRPDNTIQYAENPPKRYEDIIPLDFDTDNWQELWEELYSVAVFWIEQGVRIFRVDNPHTKPFAFWEWLIGRVKKQYPEVIFLSEAFTRPKPMQRLAKVGFDQSYTYFTWRNAKWELEQYLTELTRTDMAEYLRPNFWPNTPDILPEYLQYGGRPAFIIRLVLAATLSSNYGIYGPAFEICESRAIEGREEYLDAEKYEIKNWDRQRTGNIRAVVERVNRARRENASLQRMRNLNFYRIDNEMIIAYGKATRDLSNITIMIVNLDPYHKQSGWFEIPLEQLGIGAEQTYLLHDALSNDRYIWQGGRHYVELDPTVMPAHILKVYRRLHREQDFDYFM